MTLLIGGKRVPRPVPLRDITLSQVEVESGTPISPFAAEISVDAVRFVKEHGLLLDHYQNYLRMALFLYPNAAKEELKKITALMMILFFIDDTTGDDEKRIKESGNTAEGVTRSDIDELMMMLASRDWISPVSHNLLQAMRVIWSHFDGISPQEYYDQLVVTFGDYIYSNIDVGQIFHTMSVEEYFEFRVKNSGMRFTIDISEVANRAFLSQMLRNMILEIREVVAKIGCLSNDLFSYPKEVKDGGSDLNLVVVVANCSGLDLNDPVQESLAFRVSVEIVNTWVLQYKEQAKELRELARSGLLDSKSSLSLNLYLDCLKQVVDAAKVWQIESDRYDHEEHMIVEKRRG